MNALRWLLVAPALLAVSAAPVQAERITRKYHETYDVARGVTLKLEHGDGNVTIEPWDQDVIEVDVNIDIDFSRIGIGSKPDIAVEFEQRGQEVRVREVRSDAIGIGFHSYREDDYTYTVKAPAYTVLDLEGDDGNVSIEAWDSDIGVQLEDGHLELVDSHSDLANLRLSDGNCIVRSFQGKLLIEVDDGDVLVSGSVVTEGRFTLSDGDLRMRDSEGDFEVATEDGTVEMRNVIAGKLEIVCDDGDVDLDLVSGGGIDWDIETGDGDVDLAAQGASAEFTIDCDEGRIRVELPEESYTRREHHVSGTLGDGSGQIRIRVDDGDVTLRES